MLDYQSCFIDAYRWATMPVRTLYARRAASQNQVPIAVLFYHRISNEWVNPWTMRERDFERQINWLSANFDMISLAEAQRRIQDGYNDRPAVSITFDDGYADNCNWALPMLLRRNIPFTYFVAVEHVMTGKPFPHDLEHGRSLRPNSIESLYSLARAGVEIGSHTRNHVDLGTVHDEGTLFDEIVTASHDLEELIDAPIRYFAFPFGKPEHLNPRAFELTHAHRFAGVCSTLHEWNRISDDPFHLTRFHGDPCLARMKNWLTFDPRNMHNRSLVPMVQPS